MRKKPRSKRYRYRVDIGNEYFFVQAKSMRDAIVTGIKKYVRDSEIFFSTIERFDVLIRREED